MTNTPENNSEKIHHTKVKQGKKRLNLFGGTEKIQNAPDGFRHYDSREMKRNIAIAVTIAVAIESVAIFLALHFGAHAASCCHTIPFHYW